MADGKTTAHQDDIIDHYLRNQATSGPYTAYLALYSVAPSEDAGGTELTGNGYIRKAIGFSASSGGESSNAGIVTFTASGGAWSEIVGHSICSAETAGVILYYEDSITGPTLTDGDSYQFAVGAIDVSEI